MVGKVLTLEVTPGLGLVDLRPLVHQAVGQNLLGGIPVVGTSAEAHALVEVVSPTHEVQPVG